MEYFIRIKNDLINLQQKFTDIDALNFPKEQKEKCKLILDVSQSMIDNPNVWDNYCPFNIKRSFDQFEKLIRRQKSNINEGNIDDIYFIFIKFLVEYELSLENRNNQIYSNTSTEYHLSEIQKKYFFPDADDNYRQISYALYRLPISILNSYIGLKGFDIFMDFEGKQKEIESNFDRRKKDLDKKILEIEELKRRLDEYKTAFNFVGLSKGFEELLNQKRNAKNLSFGLMLLLAVLVLVPLGCKLFANVEITWQSMLPVAGLELILIYFFRVVLNHYHSIQTQIMQLELRQSLCQFIQSYAGYAKEIKASDKDALDKFENLIFSSILSNPDKVPGTFDGVDGLASLLKELKGK